ncbi:uncharacterized protein QC763_701440 [Podospora pseudopauciseta]|uniref:ER transporter 6TM N-terminal domain-containing protein n=1 Tax=Podospora pseudopauciseta TaxID=2093780 RepID=A0ABR0H2I5_9PEZI|nr:hypothetical protein QC763_701440 [Podospora pseudopauciseta]
MDSNEAQRQTCEEEGGKIIDAESPFDGPTHTYPKATSYTPPVPKSRNEYAPGANVDHNTAAVPDDHGPQDKKPSLVGRLANRLGLDAGTLIIMFKGSLPPTIAIAMYQAAPITAYFTTLGYLVPIVSVLALAILPRGKFLMNMILNLFSVCLGAAISMLALWSAVKARENTRSSAPRPASGTGGGQALTMVPYNSSQSAVCAVWLFFGIWLGNVVRAKLPAFNLPVIIFSIFVNVAATYGPFMTTTTGAQKFVRELLTAMLVALALAFAVNLFVFPMSSRLVVFKEFEGAIGLLRRTVKLQREYLVSLEKEDMFAVASQATGSREENGRRLTKEERAAKQLKETGDKMRQLAGKLHADIPFAKRDFAWGKLNGDDIGQLFSLFRNVYIPVLGMMTIIDIFKRVSEHRGWNRLRNEDELSDDEIAAKEKEKRVWNEVMKQMHEPFEILSGAIDQGLEHAGLCLGLLPRPKLARDVEAQGEQVRPGDPRLAKVMDEKVAAFYSKKGELLRTWVRERGFRLEDNEDGYGEEHLTEQRERDQSQLYIVLYMENLMHASGEAVQALVAFADKKVADGTMSRNRIIIPSNKRLKKLLLSVFNNEDSSGEESPDLTETRNTIVYFGDGYNRKKDPEHLPPETAWQHFGNGLRKISAFLGSEESMFGFRVACATMTVGIVAFLEETQRFFMEQRLVWAMIIIALGMTMTSGQSFFGFLCRVGGTVIAMVLSLIIWYIVDEQPAGAIVIMWFFVFISYYFFLKYPRFIPAIMITIVTQVLIIGYELQTIRLGKEIAERTGQPWYPTYLLAPYRLACVAGGSLVAFFWTIFPSPLTDRTWLRRDLSATLYLVANYFGVISSTLRSNLDDTAGDVDIPGTPAHQLHKISRKIFGKVMMLVPSMMQHSEWQRWEPTIGGKFPREAYDDIIAGSTRIMAYLTLISYTLMHPTRVYHATSKEHNGEDGDETHIRSREWLNALAKVLRTLRPTHHSILSTLTLLSNSLLSGQRLPPFLPLPRPYEMTRRLMTLSSSKSYPKHANDDEDNGSEEGPGEEDDEDNESDGAPVRLVDSRTGRDDRDEDRLLRKRTTRSSHKLDHIPEHHDGGRPRKRRPVEVNLLDPRNMEQPGYAEFAVLQVCTTLVCDDLEGLVKAVSGLVGVVDFSFRYEGSESTLGANSGNETASEGLRRRKG